MDSTGTTTKPTPGDTLSLTNVSVAGVTRPVPSGRPSSELPQEWAERQYKKDEWWMNELDYLADLGVLPAVKLAASYDSGFKECEFKDYGHGVRVRITDNPRKEVGQMDDTDLKAVGLLNAMREARDAAARYSEQLNDEASLLEIAATRKRSQSALVIKEINEDVPIPSDD